MAEIPLSVTGSRGLAKRFLESVGLVWCVQRVGLLAGWRSVAVLAGEWLVDLLLENGGGSNESPPIERRGPDTLVHALGRGASLSVGHRSVVV